MARLASSQKGLVFVGNLLSCSQKRAILPAKMMPCSQLFEGSLQLFGHLETSGRFIDN